MLRLGGSLALPVNFVSGSKNFMAFPPVRVGGVRRLNRCVRGMCGHEPQSPKMHVRIFCDCKEKVRNNCNWQ